MNLEGEVVLVTGASGNIGQGIARRLAQAGARIIAHFHRDVQSAEALIMDLGNGSAVQADLTDPEAVEAMISSSEPTMLVNNAATQGVEALADVSVEEWRTMIATNLDGPFLLTQRCANTWANKGMGGAVVNVASIEGSDPAVGHAHYAASKAGLLMFTRAAAIEYGSANIRINAVSPGLIERDSLADEWPEGVERWRKRAPLQRLGTPQDVADAVLFLLSPAARWISGTNLVVDGGMSAQSRW